MKKHSFINTSQKTKYRDLNTKKNLRIPNEKITERNLKTNKYNDND